MNLKNLKLIISLFSISLLVNSCKNADLKAAQQFGAMSDEFKNSTSKLSIDIYDSCIRRTKFYPMKNPNALKLQREEINNCDLLNRPTAQRAEKANEVIINYMVAIGKLAGDNTVNFTESLEDIGKALINLQLPGGQNAQGQPTVAKLDESQVNAGTNIVGFFLNLAKQDFQRRNLKEAIVCTDESVQIYTTGLASVFQEGYVNGILKLEQSRITSYYQDYSLSLKPEGGKVQDYMALEKEYGSALDTVLARRDAALSFIEVITKTADAHRQLKALFTEDNKPISEAELKANCQKYFVQDKTQQTNLISVQYPEKHHHITEEEREQIKAIALKYTHEVRPLLKKLDKAF